MLARRSIRLSPADRRDIDKAMRTLLSPFEHPSTNSWCVAVVREIRDLTGADMASGLFPTGGAPSIFSEEVPRTDQQAFTGRIAPLAQRWAHWDRMVQLGVWTRDAVWRPHLREYLRSSYYNEYIVPGRYFDAIGMACSTAPAGRPADAATLAGIWLHHDSPRGRRFGSRGISILDLLLPAFNAAISVTHRLAAHGTAFTRLLDDLNEPMLIASATGGRLHQNPALTAALSSDPDGTQLLGHMARLAGTLSHRRLHTGDEKLVPAEEVSTRGARYRLKAIHASAILPGTGAEVIVTLERLPNALPKGAELFDRYGLTPAQARVALLVAEGLTHEQIAERLGVSEHTVRRHTEKIRAQLRVRTTPDIGLVLLRNRSS